MYSGYQIHVVLVMEVLQERHKPIFIEPCLIWETWMYTIGGKNIYINRNMYSDNRAIISNTEL